MRYKSEREKAKVYDETVAFLEKLFLDRFPDFMLLIMFLFTSHVVNNTDVVITTNQLAVIICMVGSVASLYHWTRD